MTAHVTQMFTVDEIAERLHVHVQTVRLWIRKGELGYHKLGRYSMVSEDQLAEFLAARRHDVA
jgi:excisionase family DNA binding protein